MYQVYLLVYHVEKKGRDVEFTAIGRTVKNVMRQYTSHVKASDTRVTVEKLLIALTDGSGHYTDVRDV
jgi:hypothetical protein